jgi:hypothetical protein
MENVFTVSFHVPGTLAANIAPVFTVPFDCQLIHVSAVGSNSNSGLLIIGIVGSTAAYLASASIGDSSAPVEFDRNDFVGGEFPHLADGTVVVATLDYDGAGGTATADYTLVLTFTKG